MDPYLEGELWIGFHALFATEIVRDLNRNLGPGYVALAQQRFVMTVPEEIAVATADIYPDIGVTHKGKKDGKRKKAKPYEAPLRLETVMPARVPHTWVEVVGVARRKLVAVIEFLSPANKRGIERKKYLRKRQRILLSSAHLLEIDLLRKGKRVPMLNPLPPADYFVLLSRAENRPETEVWPIPLDTSLPAVPVPLLSNDPDVWLDLQRVFSSVYDAGRYRSLIAYSKPSDVPLSKKAMAWAKKLLGAARS
jgi:hypothetical protein